MCLKFSSSSDFGSSVAPQRQARTVQTVQVSENLQQFLDKVVVVPAVQRLVPGCRQCRNGRRCRRCSSWTWLLSYPLCNDTVMVQTVRKLRGDSADAVLGQVVMPVLVMSQVPMGSETVQKTV